MRNQSARPIPRALASLTAFVLVGAGLYPMLDAPRDDDHGDRLTSLREGTVEVRRRAAEELGTGNESAVAATLSSLIDALTDDDDDGVRSRAAHALGRNLALHPDAAEAAAAREALTRALGAANASVRGSSALALALNGDQSNAVVAGLADVLRGDDPILRGEAKGSLVTLGVKDEARLRVLLDLLRDPNDAVRDGVAAALSQIKPGSLPPSWTKPLVDALSEPNPQVRSAAAAALGKLDRDQPEACTALIRSLADKEPGVRIAAAESLDAFTHHRPALEALQHAVQHDDASEVRVAAASILCRHRSPAPAEALKTLVQRLGQAGVPAERTDSLTSGDPNLAPRLLSLLTYDDPRVRESSARTIGLILPSVESAQAVASLTSLLQDRDPAVQVVAAEALSRFGKAARTAIPSLAKAARNDDPHLSAFAAAALRRIDPPISRGD